MKKGSAEFIEMQKAFESSSKVNTWSRLSDFSKPAWDANVPAGVFYNNGETNAAFHHFMHGYGCGRVNYMHGAA